MKSKGQIPPSQGKTEKMAKLFMMLVERFAKLELEASGGVDAEGSKNHRTIMSYARYHRKDFKKILSLGGYSEKKEFDTMVNYLIEQWEPYGDPKLISISSAMNSATAFLERVDLLHLNKACFSLGVYVCLTRD